MIRGLLLVLATILRSRIILINLRLLRITLHELPLIQSIVGLVMLLEEVIDAVLRQHRFRKHLEHLRLALQRFLIHSILLNGFEFIDALLRFEFWVVWTVGIRWRGAWVETALRPELLPFYLLRLILHCLRGETFDAHIVEVVDDLLGDDWVRVRDQAVIEPLLVRLQNRLQNQLLDCLALPARFIADFHSELHHEEVEEYLLHHRADGYLLANDAIFAKFVYRISDAVVRVQLDDEEEDEYLHVFVVVEHQVDVSILQLYRKAVPRLKRQIFLPVRVLIYANCIVGVGEQRLIHLVLVLFGQFLLVDFAPALLWRLLEEGVLGDELIDPDSHHPKTCRKRAIDESVDLLEADRKTLLVQLVQRPILLPYHVAIVLLGLIDQVLNIVNVKFVLFFIVAQYHVRASVILRHSVIVLPALYGVVLQVLNGIKIVLVEELRDALVPNLVWIRRGLGLALRAFDALLLFVFLDFLYHLLHLFLGFCVVSLSITPDPPPILQRVIIAVYV